MPIEHYVWALWALPGVGLCLLVIWAGLRAIELEAAQARGK